MDLPVLAGTQDRRFDRSCKELRSHVIDFGGRGVPGASDLVEAFGGSHAVDTAAVAGEGAGTVFGIVGEGDGIGTALAVGALGWRGLRTVSAPAMPMRGNVPPQKAEGFPFGRCEELVALRAGVGWPERAGSQRGWSPSRIGGSHDPDDYVTSACVEATAWMAGGAKDANWKNKAQGPAGESGVRLRKRLAAEGKTLPLPGNDDRTAAREYIRQFVLDRDRAIAKEYGLRRRRSRTGKG